MLDIPFKRDAIQCAIKHQGRLRPGQAQGTDQGLISPVISRHLINSPLMTGGTPVAPSHRDMEATFI